ncbi:MAG: 50S ribosomal protein L18 [Bacteroidetes bacterium]|nr:MAG: 50S ribosomal protein L18 [Bacteroidota bacterium]PTM10525.1 MAG: 50S ribosomal protein L18 [Bacteroidota bacterium]
MQLTNTNRRKRIHMRIRTDIRGTEQRPRLNVFRSNRYIYAQLIDDLNGHTMAQASSFEASVANTGNKTEQAAAAGKLLAERAKAAGIEGVVFDRGGYLYHGRVKALAEGAREGGLVF